MTEYADCPSCGRPAEIVDRWVAESTSGPVECMRTRCVASSHIYLTLGG